MGSLWCNTILMTIRSAIISTRLKYAIRENSCMSYSFKNTGGGTLFIFMMLILGVMSTRESNIAPMIRSMTRSSSVYSGLNSKASVGILHSGLYTPAHYPQPELARSKQFAATELPLRMMEQLSSPVQDDVYTMIQAQLYPHMRFFESKS